MVQQYAGVLINTQVLAGGRLPDQSKGLFYPPTIVMGVNKEMRIWDEEVFGPVMTGS